jgi:hypothetical protein
LASSASSSSSGSATPGTTTIPYTPASTPTTSSGAVPVGAANAGLDPLSSNAHTVRQTSGSVLLISAFAALLAFSL